MNNMNKRLYRSDDPIFAGVCGGLAEYFDLDPTLIRILFVIVCFIGLGFPALVYFVVMLVMPKKPADYANYIDVKPTDPGSTSAPSSASVPTTTTPASSANAYASAQTSDNVAAATSYGAVGDLASAPFAQTSVNVQDPFAEPSSTPGSYAASAVVGAPIPSSATCSFSSETTCTPPCSSPGSAYTTSNPEAFDVNMPSASNANHNGIGGGIQAGFVLGIVLICLGLFGILNMFFRINLWQFWPMILAAVGLFILFTPNSRGWSLERAGNAIFIITVAVLLQFWVFGFLQINTIARVLFMMWPVLLVIIGLGIIGSVTKKSIFSLFSSLLISAALLFGVWFFGDIPGFSFNVEIPLLEDRTLRLNTPASPGASSIEDVFNTGR